MKINIISPTYSVAPQIEATDMTAIAEAGYKSVICNRPDHENHPGAHMSIMAQSAADAGLTFAQHPFDSASFSSAVIDQQRQLLSELPGPILAYCATGTRCSIVWSFVQATTMPVDDIMGATRNAGYALDYIRPQLDQVARQQGPATED